MRSLPLIAALAVLIPAGQAVGQTYIECLDDDDDQFSEVWRISSEGQLHTWDQGRWNDECIARVVGEYSDVTNRDCRIDDYSIQITGSYISKHISVQNSLNIDRQTGQWRFDASSSNGDFNSRSGVCRLTENPATRSRAF